MAQTTTTPRGKEAVPPVAAQKEFGKTKEPKFTRPAVSEHMGGLLAEFTKRGVQVTLSQQTDHLVTEDMDRPLWNSTCDVVKPDGEVIGSISLGYAVPKEGKLEILSITYQGHIPGHTNSHHTDGVMLCALNVGGSGRPIGRNTPTAPLYRKDNVTDVALATHETR